MNFSDIAEFVKEHGPSVGAGASPFLGWWGAQKAGWIKRKDARTATIVEYLNAELANERAERSFDRKKMDALEAEINHLRSELAGFAAIFSVGLDTDPKLITAARIRTLVAQSSSNLDILRAIIQPLPVIMFIKEEISPVTPDGKIRFVMQVITNHYARTYLGQPADVYQGREDWEVWGEDIAKQYRLGDMAAKDSLDPVGVREPADSPLTGTRGHFVGVKLVVASSGRRFHIGLGYHLNPDGSTIGLEHVDLAELLKFEAISQNDNQ